MNAQLKADIFQELASLDRWVPYKMVYSPKREKFDKIPHNGRHGLKTIDPTDWTNLLAAIDIVNENYGLAGVGLVMTDSPDTNGWTLIGFDYDDVTSKFKLPIDTYAEVSPSKTGVRQFAWAPTEWVAKYQDTLNCKPPGCAHAEIYIGTAPRFLTVTFDSINSKDIAILAPEDLKLIESWGMHLRDPEPEIKPFLDTGGAVLDLSKFKLTADQKKLVKGIEGIDRSETVMGLIINLLDHGASQEDILATLAHTEPLWQYLLDHREGNPDKALEFAKKEIARAYPKSKPGLKAALIGYNSKWKVAEPKPKPNDLKFPIQIFNKAPGLVGEIAKWILGASRAPREEFAYAAALSSMACLVGPCCTVGDGKLNLYIALVGGTGTGKTEAMKAGLKLVSATDAKDSVCDFPASEAALRRQLCVNPNVLIRVDELAHKFESFKGDSSNGSGLSRAILEAYDGDRMPPKPYADDKKSLPAVENPFVQILGGTTGKIWEVLQTKHLEDGTLNRFIFVSLPDDPEYSDNPAPSIALEKPLKDKLNAFFRAGRMNDLIGDVPGFGRHIEYAPEVNAALSALGPELFKKQQGEYGPLYSRFVLHVGKIASLLAVGDGRDVVGMTDYQQALAFMTWSVETTLRKVSGALAGSDFERKTKRIARKLESAKGKKMNMRDLYRFMGCSRKEMEALIDALELSGTVSTDDEDWVSLLG